MHQLTREHARRIAVTAQLLAEPRPYDALDVVRHLGFVQLDLTAAVAPSADLVLWSRLGASYAAGWWRQALDEQTLIDVDGRLRAPEDVALHRAEMAQWPGPEPRRPWQHELVAWVEANDGSRREVLDLLRREGPLTATALPDTCEVPWRSSGWNDKKNVQRLLAQLAARGEVAVAGRTDDGRERLWDLAERVYPDDPVPDAADAARLRDARRLRALGLARAKAPKTPAEPDHVGEAGEPAVVEGVKGTWRVDPAYLDAPFTGRAALLSPLDRLVFDRKRMDELFEFDYAVEMYKPAAQRIWGYWALPVLLGDRLVGKLDATAERGEGVLRVDALHLDVELTRAERALVDDEVDVLATWLGLETYSPV